MLYNYFDGGKFACQIKETSFVLDNTFVIITPYVK
jgi:hypothetical protein